MIQGIIRRLVRPSHPEERHRLSSWAQDGEDLVLSGFLHDRKTGFYVDAGAHHPFRFSNTHLFYRQGWNGINIEPDPAGIMLFKKYRPRDINLQIAVGEPSPGKEYFVMDEPALNTFDARRVNAMEAETPYRCKETVTVPVVSLGNVLDQYAKNRQIDFMTIDVETQEYDVLKTNDWERFRPAYLAVEILDFNPEELMNNEVHRFVKGQDYSLVACLRRTVIYKAGQEKP